MKEKSLSENEPWYQVRPVFSTLKTPNRCLLSSFPELPFLSSGGLDLNVGCEVPFLSSPAPSNKGWMLLVEYSKWSP